MAYIYISEVIGRSRNCKHLSTNQGVVGSIPASRTNIIKGLQISVCNPFWFLGHLTRTLVRKKPPAHIFHCGFCETDSQVGFDPEPPRKTRKRRIGRCMMLACVVDSRNSDLEPFPPLDDERRPRAALLHSQSLPTPLATKIKKRAENLRRVFI